MFADIDPINALPRLGGIVTHLCRECPVTAPAELQPLHVTPPPPPTSSSSTPSSTPSPSAGPPGGCGGATGGGQGAGGGGVGAGGDVDGAVVRRVRGAPWLPATLVDLAMALYGIKVGASVRMVSGAGCSGENRVLVESMKQCVGDGGEGPGCAWGSGAGGSGKRGALSGGVVGVG